MTAAAPSPSLSTPSERVPPGPISPESPCRGVLFVLVGPSGAGKNSIMGRAIQAIDKLRQMPTATTRPIRAGEQNGVQHFFMSVEDFKRMLAAGELLEYAEVDPGRFYGTVRHELETALRDHHELRIADIDMNGAAALKAALHDDAVLIFIEPPNVEALEARIRERGGASEEEIQIRLERAKREMPFAAQCDYRVQNIELDAAARDVITLITRLATERGCL